MRPISLEIFSTCVVGGGWGVTAQKNKNHIEHLWELVTTFLRFTIEVTAQ